MTTYTSDFTHYRDLAAKHGWTITAIGTTLATYTRGPYRYRATYTPTTGRLNSITLLDPHHLRTGRYRDKVCYLRPHLTDILTAPPTTPTGTWYPHNRERQVTHQYKCHQHKHSTTARPPTHRDRAAPASTPLTTLRAPAP